MNQIILGAVEICMFALVGIAGFQLNAATETLRKIAAEVADPRDRQFNVISLLSRCDGWTVRDFRMALDKGRGYWWYYDADGNTCIEQPG